MASKNPGGNVRDSLTREIPGALNDGEPALLNVSLPRRALRVIFPAAARRRMRALQALPKYMRGLVGSYLYDIRRYTRAASKGYAFVRAGKVRRTELRAWIMADTHKIEKALSLRAPRPGFGLAVVRRLLENVKAYVEAFGSDWTVAMAVGVLRSYQQYQTDCGVAHAGLGLEIETLSGCCVSSGADDQGTLVLTREEVLRRSCIDAIESFFDSRHSVRNFSSVPVDMASIERAVRIAQRTPSVCNRQSWKVYAYLDEADRKRVLDLQRGNTGFGNLAGGVLIVTSDLGTFFSFAERNQAWIDGGMFAMSLVYGLHAVGLGSCCLNWCAEPERDRTLMKLAGIPENEVIIMLIAVGHLPDELKVAYSRRRPVSEVLIPGRIHE